MINDIVVIILLVKKLVDRYSWTLFYDHEVSFKSWYQYQGARGVNWLLRYPSLGIKDFEEMDGYVENGVGLLSFVLHKVSTRFSKCIRWTVGLDCKVTIISMTFMENLLC